MNRIYTRLKEELERIYEKPNYMTVPAAIRELEKIEMIRGHDQIYRLDHAVTKTQKTILNAFGMEKKNEKEQICKNIEEYKKTNLNREQRRLGETEVIQKRNTLLANCDKKYDDLRDSISVMRKINPLGKMLVSFDGYLIPTDDKYFRINPSTLGFMYGGEIKCVGMITNIIGKDTNPNDKTNIFATLQFFINEVLRGILPTQEDNIYVVSPIAIYYEN